MWTLLLLPALADTTWSAAGRDAVPDHLSVETALQVLGVAPEDASYLSAATGPTINQRANIYREQELTWSMLQGEQLAAADPSGDGSTCVTLSGNDPVPGGRTVYLYNALNPPREERLTQRSGVVLASTEQGEYALVSLEPGEQVLLVEAYDNRRRQRHERLELRQEEGLLRLQRDGEGPTACFERAKPVTEPSP